MGLAAGLVMYAVASSAGLSNHLGARSAAVASCDGAFTIDHVEVNASGQITEVTVGGIDTACIGGQLSIDLTRADGVSIGTGGPVEVMGATRTVSITGLPLHA